MHIGFNISEIYAENQMAEERCKILIKFRYRSQIIFTKISKLFSMFKMNASLVQNVTGCYEFQSSL